ncbi:MAG: uroporphyrinogen decarboxylase family protein [Candidatus Brocadiia bacterium]
MTGQERFLAALRRQQPDRVPIWELIVNQPVIHALHGPEVSTFDFCDLEDLDGVTVFENQRFEPLGPGLARDEWGIVWRTESPGIPYRVDGPIRSLADLDRYAPPDPHADHRLADLAQALRRFKGRRAIVFLSHDAFEFSHYLVGMDRLLMAYATEPELAHRLARIVTDYKRQVCQRAAAMGADVLLTGDDYANRKAPLMSPDHFRTFCLPYLGEMVETAHAAGKPFIKHTDGNIWPILPDMADAGIDAIDPLEPIAGMDIGEVKARYGHRIALCGNVDCGELLSRGTPHQVVEAVKETLAKASPGGGHVLASSNSIHPAVKPENYKAMVEAGRRFGSYPLDETMVQQYAGRHYIAGISP